MRLQLLATASLFLAVTPGSLRADAPVCLLFGTTVPVAGHPGSAVFAGTAGSVLDRCGTMPGTQPYQLSNRHLVHDALSTTGSQQGFGFWVGTPATLSLRFFLGGVEQFDTGRFKVSPHRGGWWQWNGSWDRLEITGAHLVTYPGTDDLFEDPPPGGGAEPELDGLVNRYNLENPQLGSGGADDLSVVPEPATLTLLGTGLVGLMGASRRRKRREQLD
jgi:hypothetical protein